MKKTIIATTIALTSLFGAMNMAHATVPSDQTKVTATEQNNIPSSYEKYGFGEVKADGQWVNDN